MVDGGASVVIGTAGHIDHGKTSLVRMLTGVDLDAHPEEKERGITISLGFTPMEMMDGRRAALVDVPGHERLVRTMVAGATGVDAVLLCVSAVDGVMPQTREHLAILRFLGVSQGAVVLTMADLVDEELLELASEDVAELLLGTFLEGCPIVPVSSVTGSGRDALLETMAQFYRPERTGSGVFRLPVDRSFIRSGFGTIVTGTAWSGELKDGSQVLLLPSEQTARIRGIQVHGEASSIARAGWRVALNLAGVDKEDVPRGTVVVSAPVPQTSMVDVLYNHVSNGAPLKDGTSIRFLLGTSECLGRLHFAEDLDELQPGTTTWAQVRLEHPIPCLPGDRYVIRRASPMETLGGGEVVDPWAARMRHRDRVKWGQQIKRLHGGKSEVWLERASEMGLTEAEWRIRSREDVGVVLAGRRYAAPVIARLEGALLEALETYHRETPLSLGAHRRELRRGRLGHVPDKVFDALVDRLGGVSAIVLEGPLVRVTGFEIRLTTDQVVLQKQILSTVRGAGTGGIKNKELHVKHKQAEVTSLVYLLEKDAQVIDIPSVGWLHVDVLQALRDQMVKWFEGNEGMSPANFKEMTGLSRKAAIPLMEYMDRCGWTRREGNQRLPGTALIAT